MKRKLAAACISMCMVSSLLAGCGSSEQTVQNQSEQTQNSEKTQEEVKTEETTQVSENSDNNSNDAIANLIAATDAPVDLTLWCAETEEYQTVMAQLVDEFKNTYPDVQFNITIGAESEANCKDDVLKDVESAADVFVFADDQLIDLVNAGALQSVDAAFTYDPKTANAASTVEAASVDGKLYAYPLTASNGYFLFYNSDYLTEEDVSSWDNLLAAAQKQGKTVGMEVSGAWYLYGFFAGARFLYDFRFGAARMPAAFRGNQKKREIGGGYGEQHDIHPQNARVRESRMLRLATALLEASDLTLNEIASRTGFSDPYYFSHRFPAFHFQKFLHFISIQFMQTHLNLQNQMNQY